MLLPRPRPKSVKSKSKSLSKLPLLKPLARRKKRNRLRKRRPPSLRLLRRLEERREL